MIQLIGVVVSAFRGGFRKNKSIDLRF
jgi:hypothetical protein